MERGTAAGVPLVGREAELAAAVRGLTSARAGAGRGLLIGGPAGVGKTRLAQETYDRLRAAGRTVWVARTLGAATRLPLAALAGLLDPVDSSAGGPVGRALAILRRRAAAVADRPVLLVDDAHLLDEVSATVVYQLVAGDDLALLGTVRTEAAVPAVVTALWKDVGVLRLELGALADRDVDELVTRSLGGAVEGRTLHRMRVAAAGNPLLLRELLTALREAGTLRPGNGVWHLADGDRLAGALGPAPRLRELLADRLATTGPTEREALELLAVGEPVPLPVALDVVEPDQLEVLERRGLVTLRTVDDQVTVRLSHPLYGELLRAGMPELARLRHAHRLADTWEKRGLCRGSELLRLAQWRLDTGGQTDPTTLVAAARQAELVREYGLAERLARRAYQAGGGVAAGLSAVPALFRLGRLDEALRLCAELAATATDDGDRAAIAVAHATVLVYGADDVQAAMEVLDRCQVGLSESREQLAAFRLYLRSHQLDCGVIDEARALFHRQGPPELRLIAANAAGSALMLAGRFGESAALVRAAIEVARQDAAAVRPHADGLPVALGALRCDEPDPAGALALAEAAYQDSLQPPDRVGQALSAFSLARISLARGRPRAALRWAKECRFTAIDLQTAGLPRWAAGVQLQAACQLGRYDNGTELAAAVADLDPTGTGEERSDEIERGVQLFVMEEARGRAWRAALAGDRDGLRAALVEPITRHGGRGAVGSATIGALDLIRLGEAAVAAELLTVYPPPADWPLGRLTVAYAGAARDEDPSQLVRIAREFAICGLPLHAAEVAMVAVGILRAAGESQAASRARLFSDGQLALCDPVDTPGLRRGGGEAGLTERERELVLAAAGGETTRAIADRLRLSPRTVENHLHRAYGKLGVSGREELRRTLGPAAAVPGQPRR